MHPTIQRHVTRAHRLHARVKTHPKTIVLAHHSRTWLEVFTCALTAVDTHFRPLALVSAIWAIVDIVLIAVKDID